MRSVRSTIALIAAIALAIFAFPLSACVAWLVGLEKAGSSCSEALWFFSWYGSAIVVPAALLFGVPIYILFHRRGWLRWWQVGLVGLLAGFLTSIGLDLFDNYLVWYRFALLSAPLGFASGLVFWLIGVFRNVGPNNSFKPSPHQGGA